MSGEDLNRQQSLGLGWREQLAPLHEERYDSSNDMHHKASYKRFYPRVPYDTSSDGGSSSYESDWEAEVNARGEVFYVAPVEERELESFSLENSGAGGHKAERKMKKEKKGSKLSRLVKRRESKRDRNMTDHRYACVNTPES